MSHEFRHLFTPLSVGGLALKNRILSTGHAEAMAEGGRPGEGRCVPPAFEVLAGPIMGA